LLSYSFCSHKFHNKIESTDKRIIILFIQKIIPKLSEIWVGDTGSEIRNKPIPNPEVKKHRIPDPNPQHCLDEFEKCLGELASNAKKPGIKQTLATLSLYKKADLSWLH
jgi:hypothetical protein